MKRSLPAHVRRPAITAELAVSAFSLCALSTCQCRGLSGLRMKERVVDSWQTETMAELDEFPFLGHTRDGFSALLMYRFCVGERKGL